MTPIEGADEGTDRWAIEQGWISLTPLRLDLTDAHALEDIRVRRPLDEVLAAAVSPGKSSPQAAQSVREDEAPAAIPKAVGTSLPADSRICERPFDRDLPSGAQKRIHFLLGPLLCVAISLLHEADEFLGVAIHLIELVVSELAPLCLRTALQLMPLPLENFGVHSISSLFVSHVVSR